MIRYLAIGVLVGLTTACGPQDPGTDPGFESEAQGDASPETTIEASVSMRMGRDSGSKLDLTPDAGSVLGETPPRFDAGSLLDSSADSEVPLNGDAGDVGDVGDAKVDAGDAGEVGDAKVDAHDSGPAPSCEDVICPTGQVCVVPTCPEGLSGAACPGPACAYE